MKRSIPQVSDGDSQVAQQVREWRGGLSESFRAKASSLKTSGRRPHAGHQIESVLEQAQTFKKQMVQEKMKPVPRMRARTRNNERLPAVAETKPSSGAPILRPGSSSMPLFPTDDPLLTASNDIPSEPKKDDKLLSTTHQLGLSNSYIKKTTSQAERVYDPDLSCVYSACAKHLAQEQPSRFYSDYMGRTLYMVCTRGGFFYHIRLITNMIR